MGTGTLTPHDAAVILWFEAFLVAAGQRDWQEAARLYSEMKEVPGH